jgi:hypothetical protein
MSSAAYAHLCASLHGRQLLLVRPASEQLMPM